MTNYVPKDKPPSQFETDPRIRKELKKIKAHEMKYNKYQPRELSSLTDSPCTYRVNQPNANNHNNHTHTSKNSIKENVDQSPDLSPIHLYQSLESDVKEIRRFIKTLIYKQRAQESLEKVRGEWRAVALVLDRTFFCLYTISIVVSLATMFPRGT